MRCKFISVALSCALLFFFFADSVVSAQADFAGTLIQLVNAYRAENGMPPLQVNSALISAAQRQANWQATNHLHSHRGEGGSMPQDRADAAGYRGIVLENAASGTHGFATPACAVQGWASSYVHRIAMLSKSAHIGVGVAENSEEVYFILVVGNPDSGAPQPPDNPTGVPERDTPLPPPVVVVPIVVATPAADGAIIHTVQDGQTAWAIAAQYGISLDDLLALNHLRKTSILHTGDRIVIQRGQGQQTEPTFVQPATHTVQQGESLWTIAASYGLTLDELLTLNGLNRASIIKAGDVLRVRAAVESVGTSVPSTAIPTITETDTLPTSTVMASVTPSETAIPSATMMLAVAAVPTITSSPQASENVDNVDTIVIAVVFAVGIIGLVMMLMGAVLAARGRRRMA